MRFTADIHAIAQLPFVGRPPDGGRQLFIYPYHDGLGFHVSLPDSRLTLVLGRVQDVSAGVYLAREPADPASDYGLDLETLIWQNLSFQRLDRPSASVSSDISHCAAVLAKYHLIWQDAQGAHLRGSQLIASELEYLLFLIRSLYDTFQSVIREVSSLLIDASAGQRKAVTSQLPTSFADVALRGDKPRTVDELRTKYGLPQEICAWYVAEAASFERMRRVRDDVAHRGHELPGVLVLPSGFALDTSQAPWNRFAFWRPEALRNGNLGPLRLVFYEFVRTALEATERFAAVIRHTVALPEPIHPAMRCYLRGPVVRYLRALPRVCVQPWEGEEANR